MQVHECIVLDNKGNNTTLRVTFFKGLTKQYIKGTQHNGILIDLAGVKVNNTSKEPKTMEYS